MFSEVMFLRSASRRDGLCWTGFIDGTRDRFWDSVGVVFVVERVV